MQIHNNVYEQNMTEPSPHSMLSPSLLHLQVLKYTAGHINYGGRVTDDWDRRCIMNILENFYSSAVLATDYAFSESGIYRQLDAAETDHKVPWCHTELQAIVCSINTYK